MRTYRRTARYIAAALTAVFLFGCGGSSPGSRATPVPPVEPFQLGEISRLHRSPGFLLAGQPSPDDLQKAKGYGVKTVVNLRMPSEIGFDEEKVVSELGMKYVHAAISGPEALTDDLFDRLRALYRDAQNQPILVHCGSANRVGVTWLVHRVLDRGLDYETALEEAKTVGARNEAMLQKARDYIDRHK